MKFLIETVDDGILPVLEMFNLQAELTEDKNEAVSMVVEGPRGPVALEVPCADAIHTLQ